MVKLVMSHSLRAVDLSMGDCADERHYFAIMKKETHKWNGGLLLFATHLSQNVSGGR